MQEVKGISSLFGPKLGFSNVAMFFHEYNLTFAENKDFLRILYFFQKAKGKAFRSFRK